jgi:hypothetical protein
VLHADGFLKAKFYEQSQVWHSYKTDTFWRVGDQISLIYKTTPCVFVLSCGDLHAGAAGNLGVRRRATALTEQVEQISDMRVLSPVMSSLTNCLELRIWRLIMAKFNCARAISRSFHGNDHGRHAPDSDLFRAACNPQFLSNLLD